MNEFAAIGTDITAITFDDAQVENLIDMDNEAQFRDLLKWRRPDVIVVGHYAISPTNSARRVNEILRSLSDSDQKEESKCADEEFNYLHLIRRSCVRLARYVQSPLNEFAVIGTDITAIKFDDESQLSVCLFLIRSE